MLKSIATGILAALAAIFGVHQGTVAISPPQPTSVQVAAAQTAANLTTIPSIYSTTTTQQFQDLSSQQNLNQTASQTSVKTAHPNQPAQHATATHLFPALNYATKADLASSTAALTATFQSQL